MSWDGDEKVLSTFRSDLPLAERIRIPIAASGTVPSNLDRQRGALIANT